MGLKSMLHLNFVMWLFCITTLVLHLKRDQFELLRKHLIFLPIAFLPFAWNIAVRNHSYIHYFFTYKELTIFAFAIMCFFKISISSAQEN